MISSRTSDGILPSPKMTKLRLAASGLPIGPAEVDFRRFTGLGQFERDSRDGMRDRSAAIEANDKPSLRIA